ncbi:MAG: hypothetical protein KAU20_01655 [Nanoarchaeota archaeon]|nr:hypothetical protein [Nanoarchaeota archaeon]
MKTVLIATEKPFSSESRDAAIKIIKDGGLNAKVLEGYKNKDDLLYALNDVEGVIVRSDDFKGEEVIDAGNKLELIVRAGAGLDDINDNYAEQKGIVVENTPGQNSDAVAELAIQMMLRAIRPLNGKPGRELKEKKLAIHGFGEIGKRVTKIAKAFGMNIKVYDKFLDKGKAKEYGVEIADSVEDLYKRADFVSIHIPKTKETVGSINYDLMKLMPDNSVLVNTARAKVIDEGGLLRILGEKAGFKYATDVAPSIETIETIDDKFKDRFITTPKKQGAQTKEANYNAATAAAKLCVEFFVNGATPYAVNNPLPSEMREHITLAQYLGRFNRAFIEKPNKMQAIFYGELDKYREQLIKYVLKGLFQDELGKDLTPSEALEAAKDRGIELIYREPDNSRGHGRSITIDYFTEKGERHNMRGRVDENELQINRVGDFKIGVPLNKGIYVLAQYDEKTGMADKIGDALSSKGYNKIDGGFRQDASGKKALVFYRVAENGNGLNKLKDIVENNIKKIPEVYNAVIADMR